MAGHDTLVELQVLGRDDFVLTPELARLLVKLARRHLEEEKQRAERSPSKREDAA